MNCEEVRNLLWDLCEGELSGPLSEEVRAHIDSCERCAREAELCREVERALAPCPVVKAPAGPTADIMARVSTIAAERRESRSPLEALRSFAAALRRRITADPLKAAAYGVTAVALAVFVALGAAGILPHSGETGPLMRAVDDGVAAAKPVTESARGFSTTLFERARDTVTSRGYAEAFMSLLPWFAVAFGLAILILIGVIVEEGVHARQVVHKYDRFLR